MLAQPVDLLGGFYADASKPWSWQDTVNWLLEVAEVPGTRTQTKLASRPGLRLFGNLGDRPVRGTHNAEGALFAVAGNTLYQVNANGVGTARGTIPGVGRVVMNHNQVKGGNQLLVANGQSGYVWDTAARTFSKITDEGYPGAVAASYIDSYLAQVEPFGRFWFHSGLADAKDYNTLDRYQSEASPDAIVTLVVSQFEVVVFNRTTIEFFDNAGTATGTFRNKRAVIERGCAGRYTVVKIDNTIMWLGDDGVVYRLEGYQAIPVSTGPLQDAIAGSNWEQAFAYRWEDRKHKCYVLTFPDGRTWCYDVVTRLWVRLASFGLNRLRLNTLTYWNNQWIGGDFQNGRLWALDWKATTDGGQPIVRERVSGVTHANQSRVAIPYAELVVDAGTSQISDADVSPELLAADHKITMDYSDDGGRNWSNKRERSLGAQGEYGRRVRFNRMGSTRQRVYRISTSSPARVDLLGAVAAFEPTGA